MPVKFPGISGNEKFGWVNEPVFYKSRGSISARALGKSEIFLFSFHLLFSRNGSYGGQFFDRFVKTAFLMSLWTNWGKKKWMKKNHSCLSDFQRILNWILCEKSSSGCAKQPSTCPKKLFEGKVLFFEKHSFVVFGVSTNLLSDPWVVYKKT